MEPSKLAIKLSGFIPMMFPVTVNLAKELGGEGRATIPINDRPFILQWLTHQIIPNVLRPADDITGWAYQDGLYTIDWSLFEQSRFWKGDPPMADAAFGSIKTGKWIGLPAPVSMPGNENLNVILRNQVLREEDIKVHVIFHGIQRGGSQTQVGD